MRYEIPLILMSIVALMVASIDIYLPSLPFLKQLFHVDEWWMQLTIVISPLVSGLSAILYGRLSDIHGRKIILMMGLCILGCGSFICTLSTTYYSFLLGRFLQALGQGAMSTIVLSILSDLYQGVRYARYMALYSLLFPFTFALAPLVGAYVLKNAQWQMNFFIIFSLSVFFLILTYIRVPESLKERQSPLPLSQVFVKLFDFLKYKKFITLALIHSLPISLNHIFVANSAFLFIDVMKFTPIQYSNMQLFPIFFNFLGSLSYNFLLPSLGLVRSMRIGILLFFIFSCFASSILIFQFSHPFVILSAVALMNYGLTFVIATGSTLTFSLLTTDKGLGIAFVSFLRNISVGVITLCIGKFYNQTIFPVFIGMILVSSMIIILALSIITPKSGIKEI